jgi:long-chain fatty acid transport protein
MRMKHAFNIIIAATIGILASVAGATNGYFQHGIGPESKSMAGAGTALPMTSLSAVTNPAAAAYVGSRYEVGVSAFMPSVSYEVNGTPSGAPGTFGLTPGKIESDANFFAIPHAGYNRETEVGSFGLALYGNGGMSTDYATSTFYAPEAPTGVNLSQAFVQLTYAYEIVEHHALGISTAGAWQGFSADGLAAFGSFSTDVTNMTNRGSSNSFGINGRVGYFGQIVPMMSVGASYQTKTYMSEFSEYAGLFAEAGDFDVPATWNVGVAVTPVEKLTVLADVQQILYSGVQSVGNAFDPALFQQGVLLGADGAPGFGWEDMTVVKLGARYLATSSLTLSAGYSYGTQPVPDEAAMINILAPGVIQQHVTAGLGWEYSPGKVATIALGMALENTVTGPNVMEAPSFQTIDLTMSQIDVEIGFSFD